MTPTTLTTTITRAGPLDIGLLVMVAMIWASAFIAIKIAVPETGPLWLATIRTAIGAAVLAPYALWRGLILPASARMWTLVTVMAMLNVVVPFFLISWAELTIDAGMTALLMGTGPFLGLIGSHLFTHDDKMNAAKLLAVVFGFSGMAVLVGGTALGGFGPGHLLAQLATLGGVACYVVAGLIIRRIDIPPVRLAFLALSIATVALVPLALVVDGPVAVIPSAPALWALVFLGVFPTGVAYVMRFYLIRKIGYSTFSLSIYMIPAFGVLLGFLILGEALSPKLVVALALVLTGLYFAQRGGGPARSAARPDETVK
ncbi:MULTISPECIES: DMT family transporter [unclassified Roseitalea]|uniref:DMT family transporter n=1 Tax=unclassified Roseitalea TaxID=2639107 RepID=UPI00273E201A|nr:MULTISPECIES: DMT family transporter [unclassified Roseitalea]